MCAFIPSLPVDCFLLILIENSGIFLTERTDGRPGSSLSLSLPFFSTTLPATAQTEGSVEVEGQYVTAVRNPGKLSSLQSLDPRGFETDRQADREGYVFWPGVGVGHLLADVCVRAGASES